MEQTKSSMIPVSGALHVGDEMIAEVNSVFNVPRTKNSCKGSGIVFGVFVKKQISINDLFVFKINGNMRFEDTIVGIQDENRKDMQTIEAGRAAIAVKDSMVEFFLANSNIKQPYM